MEFYSRLNISAGLWERYLFISSSLVTDRPLPEPNGDFELSSGLPCSSSSTRLTFVAGRLTSLAESVLETSLLKIGGIGFLFSPGSALVLALSDVEAFINPLLIYGRSVAPRD